MAFETPKIKYSGTVREATLGIGQRAVTIGGETSYPFYSFEGQMPHRPRIALEVWDCAPEDWPESVLEPYRDVAKDPVAWARKSIAEYGADLITLVTKSADPNGLDRKAEEVARVVKAVADAIDVPLIVWGTSDDDKDAILLKLVAEVCEGKNLTIGPLSDKNYKPIGAAAIAYGHAVLASSPIDVNLAKQLNILLANLGVPEDRILIDPTTGGLGYGLEYTYSVMERDRMAALTQEDVKLQNPIICNLANEVWKTKEARTSREEDPKLGDERTRGIVMESVTAMTLLLAGADIVVMRHPEAVAAVREMIGELSA